MTAQPTAGAGPQSERDAVLLADDVGTLLRWAGAAATCRLPGTLGPRLLADGVGSLVRWLCIREGIATASFLVWELQSWCLSPRFCPLSPGSLPQPHRFQLRATFYVLLQPKRVLCLDSKTLGCSSIEKHYVEASWTQHELRVTCFPQAGQAVPRPGPPQHFFGLGVAGLVFEPTLLPPISPRPPSPTPQVSGSVLRVTCFPQAGQAVPRPGPPQHFFGLGVAGLVFEPTLLPPISPRPPSPTPQVSGSVLRVTCFPQAGQAVPRPGPPQHFFGLGVAGLVFEPTLLPPISPRPPSPTPQVSGSVLRVTCFPQAGQAVPRPGPGPHPH